MQTTIGPYEDFKVRVQRGKVAGVRIFGAMGERESIQTTAAGEDLTRMNELSPAPTSHLLVPDPADAGEQMQIVSESLFYGYQKRYHASRH
jgi:hypothetical protein